MHSLNQFVIFILIQKLAIEINVLVGVGIYCKSRIKCFVIIPIIALVSEMSEDDVLKTINTSAYCWVLEW